MDTPADDTPKKKSTRDFASMDQARRKEVAAKGGRAAQAKGNGNRFTKETASAAGRMGGKVSRGGRGRLTPPNTSAA